MVEVVSTGEFDKWLRKLRDRQGKLRIVERVDRLVPLLCGGGKSTQPKDIEKAHELADEWRADQSKAGDNDDD